MWRTYCNLPICLYWLPMEWTLPWGWWVSGYIFKSSFNLPVFVLFCLEFHAQSCQHPDKSGKAVLTFLQSQEKAAKEDKKLFDSLFNLLSFEKITLNDLQFRPFRTDEYIHKLFYETARFSAFNLQWVVKARVNDDQRDPTQSCDRLISFQLSLKSKLSTPMTIHYMILKVWKIRLVFNLV